jgi:hypothetical protein
VVVANNLLEPAIDFSLGFSGIPAIQGPEESALEDTWLTKSPVFREEVNNRL